MPFGSRSPIFTVAPGAAAGSAPSPSASGKGRSLIFTVPPGGVAGSAAEPSSAGKSRSMILTVLGEPLSPCDCGIFDDFERTVADGWGTSTDGHTWVNEPAFDPSDAAAVSVDGTRGKIVCSGTKQAELAIAGDGPWAIGSNFSMTVLMQLDLTGTFTRVLTFGLGEDFEPIYMELGPQSSGALRIGVFGTSTFDNDSSFFPGTDPFYVKWQHLPTLGISRVKAWSATDPPPDWMASRDTTDDDYGDATNGWSIFVSGRDFTTYFESIDFAACVLDDFDRVVAADGWGNATPSGYTWTPGGSGGLDVADAGGVLTPSNFAQRYAEVNEASDLWWRAPEFTMTVKWKISALGTPSNLNLNSSPTYSGVQFDLYTGGSQKMYIGSTPYVPDPWVADTWYLVKWHHNATLDEAKVWKEADPEPDLYQVSEAVGGSGGPALLDDTFGIYAYNDDAKTFTIDFVSFDLCPVPPAT